MLSDEEREALQYFNTETKTEEMHYGAILVNLIERQSKEIEELKTTKKELTERVLRLESDKFWDNVVSKDKIKAKIEEEKECGSVDGTNEMIIEVLQSLLEKE